MVGGRDTREKMQSSVFIHVSSEKRSAQGKGEERGRGEKKKKKKDSDVKKLRNNSRENI